MTPPAPTTRQNPLDAKMLEDGYRIKITLAEMPDVAFWDKTITPPAIMGGDEIDITTQFTQASRQKAPRQLYEVGETTVTAAWDPKYYSQVRQLTNKKTTVTVTFFARKKQIAFYGYLKDSTPQEFSEGTQPEIELTIICTNTDPVTGEEAEYTVHDLP